MDSTKWRNDDFFSGEILLSPISLFSQFLYFSIYCNGEISQKEVARFCAMEIEFEKISFRGELKQINFVESLAGGLASRVNRLKDQGITQLPDSQISNSAYFLSSVLSPETNCSFSLSLIRSFPLRSLFFPSQKFFFQVQKSYFSSMAGPS